MMEEIQLELPSSKRTVCVGIDRKRMKTCRLKVYPDQSIIIAVPLSAPTEWVKCYVDEKATWIEKKLTLFHKTEGYAATKEIIDGYSVKILGEDMIISVSECTRNKIYREGKVVHVLCQDVNNQAKLLQLFDAWWRKEAYQILEERVQLLYPIIGKYNIPMPKIALRKMKTLWGSCSASRGIVYFNQYLIKAKPAYIDYVVLHELVHFIYPNHSKSFYDFLSNYMPDWKDRKRELDREVVHGL